VHVIEDAFTLARRDDRPHLCAWVERVAHDKALGLACQLVNELVIDAAVHDVSRCANAGLTGADEGAERGVVHGLVYAVVIEHDHRRLATQLKCLAHKVAGCGGARAAPCFGASGQHQFVDARVLGKRLACSCTNARHDVEDPVRQTCFRKDLG